MSRSVRSLAMTKGATPASRASPRRWRRSASKRVWPAASSSSPSSAARARGPPGRPLGPGRRVSRRRQQDAGRPGALHDGPALLGQEDHRPVAAAEADPPGRHAPAQEPEQPLLGMLAQVPERGHLREAGALEPGIGLAADEPHDHPEAEAVVEARHPRERLPDDERDRVRVLGRVAAGERAAHVTPAAAGQRLRLVAEVAEDGVVPAAPRVGPAHQLQEEAPLVLEHRRVGRGAVLASVLDQPAAERQVARAHEQEPDGVLPVASRAADLLVVGLDRPGRAQVHDGADVGPVDAHPEGVGAGDDLQSALGEVALDAVAGGAGEPGVIGGGAPAPGRQALRLRLGALARRRVHDGPAAPGARRRQRLGQRRVHQAGALAGAAGLAGAQGEVRPGEAVHDLGRVGRQAEARHDLVTHHRRRGRRAGQHARRAQVGEERADLEVLRAEVVAPLADAVRLVDRDQRAGERGERLPEPGRDQPLGRHVDEPDRAARDLPEPAAQLARLERGGQEGGGHAARRQRLHLIVHERDERRDDERRAGEEAGGELVRQALPAAGGGDQQEAPALQERLDRLALARAERRVAQPAEARVELGWRGHGLDQAGCRITHGHSARRGSRRLPSGGC